jgi:hypothetical protein
MKCGVFSIFLPHKENHTYKNKDMEVIIHMAQQDIDVFDDIKGFGLGLLYQVLLILFHIAICIGFILELILHTTFLEIAVPVSCAISILITVIDLIVSVRYCFINKIWAFLILDIWFFCRYTILPVILLILSLII